MKAAHFWKWVGIGVIIIVLGYACFQWARRLPERQSKVAFGFALMTDLGEYAGENEGTMPRSWSAFEEWCQRTNRRAWKAEELGPHYVLAWGAKVKADEDQILVTIVDPDLARYQAPLNERLRRVGIGELTARSPQRP